MQSVSERVCKRKKERERVSVSKLSDSETYLAAYKRLPKVTPAPNPPPPYPGGRGSLWISGLGHVAQWISPHKEGNTQAAHWPLWNKAATDIKTNISGFLKDEKRNPSPETPASFASITCLFYVFLNTNLRDWVGGGICASGCKRVLKKCHLSWQSAQRFLFSHGDRLTLTPQISSLIRRSFQKNQVKHLRSLLSRCRLSYTPFENTTLLFSWLLGSYNYQAGAFLTSDCHRGYEEGRVGCFY